MRVPLSFAYVSCLGKNPYRLGHPTLPQPESAEALESMCPVRGERPRSEALPSLSLLKGVIRCSEPASDLESVGDASPCFSSHIRYDSLSSLASLGCHQGQSGQMEHLSRGRVPQFESPIQEQPTDLRSPKPSQVSHEVDPRLRRPIEERGDEPRWR